MKFETLKKDNKKKIAMGIIAVISITLVGVFASSFAKYKLTQSIPLANGTINYKAYDFKIMAMYQQKAGSTCTEDNCYDEITTMPSASNYKINETKSYCTLDNKNKDNKAILKTENGKHIISSLSKSDKCYLYFDKIKISNVQELIANLSLKAGATSFTGVATTDEGVFVGSDDDGATYYYRGSVNNNYLKFAGFWWRIIRINGDGTIRIIYDGTAYHANGSSTTDSIAVANIKFNANYNDNAYVGFMYGTPGSSTYAATHTNANKSAILVALETWYNNNLASYASKIDTNAGFCGDRSINTGTEAWFNGDTKKGYGKNATAYGAYGRMLLNDNWRLTQTPTFNCPNSNDLYTVSSASKGNKALNKPIGLITVDEVIYVGGLGGKGNNKYYLQNGNAYWTMSPARVFNNEKAYVFYVNSGALDAYYSVDVAHGVRPVINLRADIAITGSGTGDDPYVVN